MLLDAELKVCIPIASFALPGPHFYVNFNGHSHIAMQFFEGALGHQFPV